MTPRYALSAALSIALAGAATAPALAAVDAAAADALVEKSQCYNCHTVAQAKAGPSYKDVARKYKGQADAPDKLYKHATSRPIVKVDGNMEEHATLKSKNPAEIRNVIEWILTR